MPRFSNISLHLYLTRSVSNSICTYCICTGRFRYNLFLSFYRDSLFLIFIIKLIVRIATKMEMIHNPMMIFKFFDLRIFFSFFLSDQLEIFSRLIQRIDRHVMHLFGLIVFILIENYIEEDMNLS